MKIVINCEFGGFGISEEAIEWLMKKKGWTLTTYTPKGDLLNPDADFVANQEHTNILGKYSFAHWWRNETELRCHPDLIECIKSLGAKANGRFADLKVITIPDGIEWEIKEYDGLEHIAEKHRTWD